MGTSNCRPVRLSVTLSVSRRVSAPRSLLTTIPGLVGFITGPFRGASSFLARFACNLECTPNSLARGIAFAAQLQLCNKPLHTPPYGHAFNLQNSHPTPQPRA